jgi:hypothetical protein
MERTDVVILVNSTPKYYYILNFFFGMLKRYAYNLKWDIVLATEEPNHPTCKLMETKYNIKILPIPVESSGFLDSRLKALQLLSKKYTYCLPLQDDFILEGSMNAPVLEKLFTYFEADPTLVSARLMPCPGPVSQKEVYPFWASIGKTDEYKFVFQATLWKTEACLEWYSRICGLLEMIAPLNEISSTRRLNVELKENIAENRTGQAEFSDWSNEKAYKHIAWIRRGSWANAVYLCPFPYRPTAIVRGQLEMWADELAKREGFFLT